MDKIIFASCYFTLLKSWLWNWVMALPFRVSVFWAEHCDRRKEQSRRPNENNGLINLVKYIINLLGIILSALLYKYNFRNWESQKTDDLWSKKYLQGNESKFSFSQSKFISIYIKKEIACHYLTLPNKAKKHHLNVTITLISRSKALKLSEGKWKKTLQDKSIGKTFLNRILVYMGYPSFYVLLFIGWWRKLLWPMV